MDISKMTLDEVTRKVTEIVMRWKAVGGYTNFPAGDLHPDEETFLIDFAETVLPVLTRNEWDFARGAEEFLETE